MSTADGTVLGTTKILNNGSPSGRWNLVILGDGYRANEMTQFATHAQQFVDRLIAEPPFSEPVWPIFTLPFPPLYSAINVYRVDVISTDSGADDPSACGGSGASTATYFDASFCSSNIRRALVVNNGTVFNVLASQMPQWHMAMVIVNTPIYGGTGGEVAAFSMAAGAFEIGLHEMGHTAFGLADEYEYLKDCSEIGHDHHPAAEPAEANVTTNIYWGTIKWRNLIATDTRLPTMSNPDCSQCDNLPSPVPANIVGAFEGAHYYHCGCYRPQYNCKMRTLNSGFCVVCQERIRDTLLPYVPMPDWWEALKYYYLYPDYWPY